MKIINHTTCLKIEEARLIVLKHFKDKAFLEMIEEAGKFNHTDDSGIMIGYKIENFSGTVYLRTYRPFNPFTRAIAFAQLPSIYFNSRKDFPVIDRVETISHEICHLLGYGHKGNYVTEYNLGSVPYKVARLFVEYLNDGVL